MPPAHSGGGGGGDSNTFFFRSAICVDNFKRQIRGTRRSDSNILTSKKKKKVNKFFFNPYFFDEKSSYYKNVGGTFDIVSPTCKIVGGTGPPRPPRDFRPCMWGQSIPYNWTLKNIFKIFFFFNISNFVTLVC